MWRKELTNKKNTLAFIIFYLFQYLIVDISNGHFAYPVLFDAVVFIGVYLSYVFNYRRENILCVEFLMLPLAFIGLFFRDLILPNVVDNFSFSFITNSIVEQKSHLVQMIAYLTLILGCIKGNEYARITNSSADRQFNRYVNYKFVVYVISIILLLLIIYDYRSGTFTSWFYYSNRDLMDVDDRNRGLGHLTCLFTAGAMADIANLRQLGVSTYKEYFIKCNKLFISEWVLISVLLYLSGNRNEMLLIVLPLVIAFSICIKKISNKVILIALVIGAFFMVVSGLTRQEGVITFSGNELDLLSFTRDFAPLAYNTDFLISYTDMNGYLFFKDIPATLLSGIPVIGPMIINSISSLTDFAASAVLTTESAGTFSGMGTSLVGDLYYTAGIIWVIVFMYIFGYTMSKLYYSEKSIGIYKLSFYSFMVANSIYYVRSAWAFPITIIEYVFVIIFLLSFLFRKKTV